MIPCRPPLINTDPNHHPCRHVLQICQRHNIRCLRWPRSSPTLALIRVTTRDPTNAQSLNYFLHLKPKSTTLVIYSEIYRFWLLYESPNCRLVLSLAEKELPQWNSPPTFFYPSPILISASSSIPFSPHRYLFTRPLDIPQTSQAVPLLLLPCSTNTQSLWRDLMSHHLMDFISRNLVFSPAGLLFISRFLYSLPGRQVTPGKGEGSETAEFRDT